MRYTLSVMKLVEITDFLGFTRAKDRQEIEPDKKDFDRKNIGPKEVYMSWEGYPEPISNTINPRFKRTLLIISAVVAFIFILLQEYFLLIFVASVFFVVKAASGKPTEDLKYELSSHGISINGEIYYWDKLERFFFSSQFGSENISVDVKEGLPSRLFLPFKDKDKKKIMEFMNRHISFLEEEPKTFLDKAYNSIVDKFDIEKKTETR